METSKSEQFAREYAFIYERDYESVKKEVEILIKHNGFIDTALSTLHNARHCAPYNRGRAITAAILAYELASEKHGGEKTSLDELKSLVKHFIDNRPITPISYDFGTRAACLSYRQIASLKRHADAMISYHGPDAAVKKLTERAKAERGYNRKRLLVALWYAYQITRDTREDCSYDVYRRIAAMSRGYGYRGLNEPIQCVFNKYSPRRKYENKR